MGKSSAEERSCWFDVIAGVTNGVVPRGRGWGVAAVFGSSIIIIIIINVYSRKDVQRNV